MNNLCIKSVAKALPMGKLHANGSLTVKRVLQKLNRAKRSNLILAVMLISVSQLFAYDFEIDGIYYNYNASDTTCSVTYASSSYASYFGDVNIPSSVTYKNKNLPVTSIGKNAFYQSEGLLSVSIPNSITLIDDYAFGQCHALESVSIPNSVTTIGLGAFHLCLKLTYVDIPNSVTSIGGYAFSYTNIKTVNIPPYVTFSYSAFDNTGLTEVYIPSTIDFLGSYTFTECKDLSSVIFEDGENELIYYDAFAGSTPKYVYFGRQINFTPLPCTNLETVEFGENVKSIVSGAFKDGSKIRTVKVYNSVPPETDDTFSGKTYIDGVLYVPEGSEDAYAAAPGWKDFWEIKTMQITTAISDVCDGTQYSVSDGVLHIVGDAPVRVVAINGAVIYSGKGDNDINLNKGMYIVVIGDKASKVVVR